MRVNKRLFIYTVLFSLALVLVLSSCIKDSGTVNENPNDYGINADINGNGSSYSENETVVITPELSGNKDSDDNSGNEGCNNDTYEDTGSGRPDADENSENGKTPSGDEEEILKIDGLVRVQDIDPDIVVDLKYATEDNFTGKKIYPHDVCVLREETAIKLAKANRELMEMGYRIKVWDAYRPVYVQRILWETVPDSRYVANPDKGGSKHNRGTAVDVTLVDMEGNELEMPSGFDDFTGKGSRNNKNMSENARRNMELLTEVMLRNGFTTISTEWWHFNDSDSDKFDIVDVNLEKFLEYDASAAVSTGTSLIVSAVEKLKDITGESEQVIFVCADGHEAYRAVLYTFEKQNGQWKTVFEPMKAVIGSRGISYDKKEGDRKSPAGAFRIFRCFGRTENPGTKLLYTRFSQGDFWVDDPSSPYYNTYQKGPAGGRWNSAEDLYVIGETYKYFIVIEYNTENPVAGKGSAIFLHVWKNENTPTAGCTAVSEENLLKLIKWLDPSLNPLILQFPAEDVRNMIRRQN